VCFWIPRSSFPPFGEKKRIKPVMAKRRNKMPIRKFRR